MTSSELKIVINPQTGGIKTIQLVAPDAKSQSEGFKAYQALSEEINHFAEKASKLIRLERVMGRL